LPSGEVNKSREEAQAGEKNSKREQSQKLPSGAKTRESEKNSEYFDKAAKTV
jgi:hypothetical protein